MKLQKRSTKAIGAATVAAFLLLAACGSESDSTLTEVEAETNVGSTTTTEPVAEVAETSDGAISIETEVNFVSQPPGGIFVVEGGADVLGCDAGLVAEIESPEQIINTFTCKDGDREGTFTIAWSIVEGSEGPGDVNGPWQVLDATDEFAGLTGDGLWSGTGEGDMGFGSFDGAVEFGPAVTTEADPAIVGELTAFVAAFFTDDTEGAWNTVSARCQDIMDKDAYRETVAALTLVTPGGTVSDISTVIEGERAAVTYYVVDTAGTVTAPYIGQPWSFNGDVWQWDAC